MRAFIIGNGDIKDFSIIKSEINITDIIVCCDGGLKYCFQEGVMPHYIIGDMDSSSQQMIQFFELRGVVFKKFSQKKDETDMELAIDFCIGLGVTNILIYGATGSRLDHTITNINLLVRALQSNVKSSIIDSNNYITVIDSEAEIFGEIGDIISLIPITSVVDGITTTGLEYHLYNETLYMNNSRGVSNKMVKNKATITLKKGYLCIIKSED